MKKLVLFLMCAAMFITSCTKDESLTDSTQGDTTTITVKLNSPATTRTAYDADKVLSGMTVRLFVIHVDGEKETVVDVPTAISNVDFTGNKSITFSQRLVKGQKYKLAVWADYGKGYYTFSAAVGDAEPTIGYSTTDGSIGGSNTDRDAYVAIETVTGGQASYALSLKRPFGMIKVTTNDYAENVVVKGGMLPTSYEVTYNAYTKFSLSTGKATEKGSVIVKNAVAQTGTWTSGQLSYDYLFANDDSEIATYKVDYITANGSKIDYTFENIPLRCNYITSISGNLLTQKGDVKVTISEADNRWSTVNKEIVEATNTTEFKAKILEAAANQTSDFVFKMSEPVAAVSGETVRNFTVPDAVTGAIVKTVELDFSKGISIPIVIADATPGDVATNYKGAVTVVVPNGTTEDKVTVTLPNAHVVIKTTDGTIIKEMTASTSGTTLVIESGVTVQKLTITGGNVDNYGTLGDIVIDEANGKVVTINNYGTITGKITVEKGSYVLTATASTADELRAAMINPNLTGVILMADVSWESQNPGNGASDNQDAFKIGINDATDYYASRPMDGFVLDGNGHTISGVAYNNVFAVYAHNVTIKNVIIEQTATQKATRPNGALSIYRSTGVKLENVTLRNTGKAGLTINAATATATDLHTSGNAWGGVDVTKGGAPSGGNKPVFTFDNSCVFGEDPQVSVSLDRTGDDYTVNAPLGWVSGLKHYSSENKVAFVYSSTPFTPVTVAPVDKSVVLVAPNAPTTNGTLYFLDNVLYTIGQNVVADIQTALANVAAEGTVKVATSLNTGKMSFTKKVKIVGVNSPSGVKPTLTGAWGFEGGSAGSLFKNFTLAWDGINFGGAGSYCILYIAGINQTFEDLTITASSNLSGPGAAAILSTYGKHGFVLNNVNIASSSRIPRDLMLNSASGSDNRPSQILNSSFGNGENIEGAPDGKIIVKGTSLTSFTVNGALGNLHIENSSIAIFRTYPGVTGTITATGNNISKMNADDANISVTATNNYWGNSTGPSVGSSQYTNVIYGNGRSKVVFAPYATAAISITKNHQVVNNN